MDDDNDPVAFYLREGCAFPPLTRKEEIELSQHVLAHDRDAESAAKSLKCNLALVVSIAEGYLDSGMHVLDLI